MGKIIELKGRYLPEVGLGSEEPLYPVTSVHALYVDNNDKSVQWSDWWGDTIGVETLDNDAHSGGERGRIWDAIRSIGTGTISTAQEIADAINGDVDGYVDAAIAGLGYVKTSGGGYVAGTAIEISGNEISALVATGNRFGVVKVGEGLSVYNGVVSADKLLLQADWSENNPSAASYIKNRPAIPSALADLNADSAHRTVTDAEKSRWNAKSNFSGDFKDLLNKPDIPYVVNEWRNTPSNTATVSESLLKTLKESLDLFGHDLNDLFGIAIIKENKDNKVTALSSSSDDQEYPSAKCVYDALQLKVNKPSGNGTSGQVLATNGDGTTYWRNMESGGGGTAATDYADLDNKPQINNVTLIGNKTFADLGISALADNATILYDSSVGTNGSFKVPIDNDSIVIRSGVVKVNPSMYFLANSASTVASTGSYSDLSSKPAINNVTLSGNMTSSALHLAAESHTHQYSDIQNLIYAFDNYTIRLTDGEHIGVPIDDFTIKMHNNVLEVDTNQIATREWVEDKNYLTPSGITGKLDKPSAPGYVGDVLTCDGQGGAIWQPYPVPDISRKVNKPSTGDGQSGQVLATNGDGTTYWVNQSGGGQGTSDFNQLSNKPQINSVTLGGNKTPAELGLAAAGHTHSYDSLTDKPDIPDTEFVHDSIVSVGTDLDFTLGISGNSQVVFDVNTYGPSLDLVFNYDSSSFRGLHRLILVNSGSTTVTISPAASGDETVLVTPSTSWSVYPINTQQGADYLILDVYFDVITMPDQNAVPLFTIDAKNYTLL